MPPVVQAEQCRDPYRPVLASWVLLLPTAVIYTVAPAWEGLLRGPLVTIVYAVLIIACAFFYTAFLIDLDAAAATLQAARRLHARRSPRRAHGRVH